MVRSVCAIGDIHGHLQLAFCLAARWQKAAGAPFDIVLLCGDVGSFTHESQLDNATRRHARTNPCELEFLLQWAATPPPPWLDKIFQPIELGGRGLACPVVMVHGNHEGFTRLESLVTSPMSSEIVEVADLPGVDSSGRIQYLPSGCRCRTPGGLIVGAVGGIEEGQRRAEYHELAYVEDEAVLRIVDGPNLDVLITHQGPATTQGAATVRNASTFDKSNLSSVRTPVWVSIQIGRSVDSRISRNCSSRFSGVRPPAIPSGGCPSLNLG